MYNNKIQIHFEAQSCYGLLSPIPSYSKKVLRVIASGNVFIYDLWWLVSFARHFSENGPWI